MWPAPVAASIARMTRSIGRRLSDHGDDELVEIAAKRAITQPIRSIGFSLAATRYWFVCKQSFNDDFETDQEAGKRPVDCNWPNSLSTQRPQGAQPLVVW